MGENLPGATLGAHNNISSSHRAGTVSSDLGSAQSTHPGHADLSAGRTTSHESPVGVTVRVVTPPFGEFVQPPGDVAAITTDIPWGGRSSSAGARCFVDGEIAQTNRHVE